jgi:DNA (cytosine-5)-methyltransferase 1
MTDFDIIDGFAGPGGWDMGLHLLGKQSLGLELDDAACATRMAAGLPTLQCDISTVDRSQFKGITGMIMSPPCQSFSRAGRGLGLDDVRGQLVFQVIDWATELRPKWIACEQVPGVLPIWKAFAEPLRDMGYKVWYGHLDAVDYGVPQYRQRAILMAHMDRQVSPPPATHGSDPHADIFSDTELLPYVTMAQALGWDGRVGFARKNDLDDGNEYRERDMRDTDRPSFTVTEKARSWELVPGSWADGRGGNRRTYDADTEPAPTLHFGHDAAGWRWQEKVLNTGRDWKEGGTRDDAQTRDTDEPAPSVTGQAMAWQWRDRHFQQDGRPSECDPDWPLTRPASTIAGRGLVPDPGANANAENGKTKSRNNGYRVEPWEAGVLQTFPHDYPWTGTVRKIFQQIGNAVPPFLAASILKELVDP